MKTIQIPEGYEFSYISENEIILKQIEPVYPMSVFEITPREWYINGDVVDRIDKDTESVESLADISTEQRAKAHLALIQLIELRDAWNRIDGFVVDWINFDQDKWCITQVSGEITINIYGNMSRVLYFRSLEMAKLFHETFKQLIETAKELL